MGLVMCGRYSVRFNNAAVQRLYNLQRDVPYDLKYNVAPTNLMPVVRQAADGTRHADRLRWGLIPFWAKEAKVGYSMINARAETIDEKAAFKTRLKKRRCIVPVSGFYEWEKLDDKGKVKQPWYIYPADGEIWSFAGLWESWTDKASGEAIESYTIVTTQANKFMATMHDRMPVILDDATISTRLDPKVEDVEVLKDFLRPAPGEWMARHKVNSAVGNVKTQGPDCIAPLTE